MLDFKNIRSARRQAFERCLKLFGRLGGMNYLPYRQNVTYTMQASVVATLKFKSVLVLLAL